MKRSDKDFVDQFLAYGIYIPTRTIELMTEIDGEAATRTIKNLHILSSISQEKEITILLNSIGGTQDDGLAIFDAIRECQCPVTIKGSGSIMSTAAWIMQAADIRIMTKNSRMMLHTGQLDLGEGHPEYYKRWVIQFQKDEEIFEDILLEKIRVKKPKFTKKQVKEMLKFDTILTPEEALNYNLIDEVSE